MTRRAPSYYGAIFIIAVVLGLAIPIAYVALSYLGAVTSSTLGIALASLFVGLLLASIVAAYLYAYGHRRISAVSRAGAAKVSSVMTESPVFCGNADTLEECAHVMYEKNVGFLVIQDEQDRPVGVVTDRDLVCGGIANGMDPRKTPVSLILNERLVSIRPAQPLREALRIMQEEGVRRLVVMEPERGTARERCVGIVSLDDLIAGEAFEIREIAPIVRRQLEEPGVRHDLREGREERAA